MSAATPFVIRDDSQPSLVSLHDRYHSQVEQTQQDIIRYHHHAGVANSLRLRSRLSRKQEPTFAFQNPNAPS